MRNEEMKRPKVPETLLPKAEEQLCFAIYSAGHAFTRLYRTVLADLGLTYPQYLVMLVLWDRDAIPVKAIGERLMLDSGTLTPLLKRLESVGLIRRERDRKDERQVRVHLTEAGQALRERARGVPARMACAIGGSPDRAGRLADDLRALRATLLKAADEPG
jgi:DNA-binding MarR family transcriptional regulator